VKKTATLTPTIVTKREEEEKQQ